MPLWVDLLIVLLGSLLKLLLVSKRGKVNHDKTIRAGKRGSSEEE
jgi:hypothetical protein